MIRGFVGARGDLVWCYPCSLSAIRYGVDIESYKINLCSLSAIRYDADIEYCKIYQ